MFTYVPRTSSVQFAGLVDHKRARNFLLKQWVKTIIKRFKYLSKKFPKVRATKLKEGIFVGPQI